MTSGVSSPVAHFLFPCVDVVFRRGDVPNSLSSPLSSIKGLFRLYQSKKSETGTSIEMQKIQDNVTDNFYLFLQNREGRCAWLWQRVGSQLCCRSCQGRALVFQAKLLGNFSYHMLMTNMKASAFNLQLLALGCYDFNGRRWTLAPQESNAGEVLFDTFFKLFVSIGGAEW